MAGNIRLTPKFIKAKNEVELQNKMLRLNFLTGRQHEYLTIYPVKDGVIAWLITTENIGVILNGDK